VVKDGAKLKRVEFIYSKYFTIAFDLYYTHNGKQRKGTMFVRQSTPNSTLKEVKMRLNEVGVIVALI